MIQLVEYIAKNQSFLLKKPETINDLKSARYYNTKS